MNSINDITLSIAGAGNVGSFLAMEFHKAGCRINQIYSRSFEHAFELSQKVNSIPVNIVDEINPNTDVIFVALPDNVIPSFFDQISGNFKHLSVKPVLASTAGSVLLDELRSHYSESGVFYPLQSFTRYTRPEANIVPICIEGSNELVALKLSQIASLISSNVKQVDSSQRLKLHLAAVYACNFSNHMIALADLIANNAEIDFDILRPLIKETFTRLNDNTPSSVQTGPAVRGDVNTINKHLKMLEEFNDPSLKAIYSLVSESIIKKNSK